MVIACEQQTVYELGDLTADRAGSTKALWSSDRRVRGSTARSFQIGTGHGLLGHLQAIVTVMQRLHLSKRETFSPL
ncbi:hypothetical protein C7293_19345 [filamentous cyanobacterium CCT1]|nr:hypothetical protein C7293_19345 [filamentous cyanobacterium CCT1]